MDGVSSCDKVKSWGSAGLANHRDQIWVAKFLQSKRYKIPLISCQISIQDYYFLLWSLYSWAMDWIIWAKSVYFNRFCIKLVTSLSLRRTSDTGHNCSSSNTSVKSGVLRDWRDSMSQVWTMYQAPCSLKNLQIYKINAKNVKEDSLWSLNPNAQHEKVINR